MGSVDFKLVLIGQKAVGKTCIFNRYVYNEVPNTQMTVGAYFAVKEVRIKEDTYNVAIWDTAGEEKFDSLTSYYCKGAQAAVLCYDITDFVSFQNLQHWVSKIKEEAEDNCSITIIGNKLDLVEKDLSVRKVDFKTANEYAETLGAELREVSAFSGKGVNESFVSLITRVVQNNSLRKDKTASIQLSRRQRNPSSSCCK